MQTQLSYNNENLSFSKTYKYSLKKDMLNGSKADYTLSEWINIWWEKYAKRKLCDNTLECYYYARQRAVKQWPELESMLLTELTPALFQDFLDFLGDLSYGWSSINHVKCLYSKVYGYAMKHGLCRINPAKAAEVPDYAHREQGRPLTSKELQCIDKNKHLLRSMDFYTIQFLRYTGVRKSELKNLKWKDVNFEEKYIKINKSKTKKGIRLIPLIPETINILSCLYQQNEAAKNKSVYVFKQPNGKPYTKEVFNGICRRIEEITQIKNITPHMFRHTFATMLVEKNVDYKTIAQVIGHESIAFTMQTYVKHDIEYLRSGLMKLSEISS